MMRYGGKAVLKKKQNAERKRRSRSASATGQSSPSSFQEPADSKNENVATLSAGHPCDMLLPSNPNEWLYPLVQNQEPQSIQQREPFMLSLTLLYIALSHFINAFTRPQQTPRHDE